jgi:hypothetical protein
MPHPYLRMGNDDGLAYLYVLCKGGNDEPLDSSHLNISFDAFPNREWIISPSALLLTSRFHFR